MPIYFNENSVNLDGTIYLWTHNTATNNLYTSDDYATYNLLGGVGTNAALSSGVSTSKPDGNIASGQSFFVTSINNTGDLKFNNSMQLDRILVFLDLMGTRKQNKMRLRSIEFG
jgi:hypothetical protein